LCRPGGPAFGEHIGGRIVRRAAAPPSARAPEQAGDLRIDRPHRRQGALRAIRRRALGDPRGRLAERGEHGQADGSGDVGEGEIEKNANADDDAEDEEEDEVGEGEELGETERETEQNANHAGRIILVDETKEYDLLQLRDDVTAALGGGELPLGRYHQIRFILEDEGHYVQVGDETHDLTVPSGDKSGVKIIGKFEIKEGEKLILTLDFDAEKSIHVTGQGEWMMKPVIKIKSLEEVDKEGKRAARAFEGDKVEDDTQLGNKPAEAGQQTGNKPADAGKTGEDPEEDGEDEEPTEPPVEEPVDEPEDPPVVIDPDTNQ